MLTSIVSVCK